MLGGSKHRPHPEEHRTEVGLAGLRQLKKGRNRQQPISIAMRLEGWRESRNVSEKLAINGTSQCLGRSFETAAQEGGLLRLYVPSLAEATHPRCGCEGYPEWAGQSLKQGG